MAHCQKYPFNNSKDFFYVIQKRVICILNQPLGSLNKKIYIYTYMFFLLVQFFFLEGVSTCFFWEEGFISSSFLRPNFFLEGCKTNWGDRRLNFFFKVNFYYSWRGAKHFFSGSKQSFGGWRGGF